LKENQIRKMRGLHSPRPKEEEKKSPPISAQQFVSLTPEPIDEERFN